MKEDLGKELRKVLREPSRDSEYKQIFRHGLLQLAQHCLAALQVPVCLLQVHQSPSQTRMHQL